MNCHELGLRFIGKKVMTPKGLGILEQSLSDTCIRVALLDALGNRSKLMHTFHAVQIQEVQEASPPKKPP